MAGTQTPVEPGSLLAATAAVVAAAMLALWLLSLLRKDASIADIFWGPGFVLIAAAAYGLSEKGDGGRRVLVLGLTALWGLRLGGYLLWRNWGEGEDPRYQAMRRRFRARFPIMSLASVFGLQGALMWLVSLPVQLSIGVGGPPLGVFDGIGALLVVVGLGFEAIGDLQLARFRANPANADQVMDEGLWRYTRHPNYFGDCVVWWGLFTISLSTPVGIYAVLSPALMTFLLLRVSGVALLERSIAKRRPGYAAYVERTNAFLPGPPRG